MMKYLQKLGKALMLPVAVLPICGILMGLGYALAPGQILAPTLYIMHSEFHPHFAHTELLM